MRLSPRLHVVFLAVCFFFTAFTLTGCPDPAANATCEGDEDCSAQGLFCVNERCQRCRDDSHCGDPSQGMICRSGSCERLAGFCANSSECPVDQRCRDNRCGPECLADAECGASDRCDAGRCVQRDECLTNRDCPQGTQCKNTRCVRQPACNDRLAAVHFDFDEHAIRSDQRDSLAGNSRNIQECLERGVFERVQLTGHCDDRGTEEYNMILGEKRAKSVENLSRASAFGASTWRPRREVSTIWSFRTREPSPSTRRTAASRHLSANKHKHIRLGEADELRSIATEVA